MALVAEWYVLHGSSSSRRSMAYGYRDVGLETLMITECERVGMGGI